ncbi:MAG: CIA30 family protein [Candidatus Hadarchaeales archaeon]
MINMKNEKGMSTIILVAAVVIVVFVVAIGYFLTVQPGGGKSLKFADFESAGTSQGGNRGIMPSEDLISEEDVSGGYSGKALKLTYSFADGEWCGYWMFFNASESAVDVSEYSHIKMWVKGASGNEIFKLELQDTSGGQSYKTGISVPGTSWSEISIPLSEFTKVPWAESAADLSKLKQVNIVFDVAPRSGTAYFDEIRFTG